jgi:two-component system response regulator AtoC
MDVLRTPPHETLLGVSKAAQELNKLIERLARAEITVLITGESGTGKDVAARVLHKSSMRSGRSFIKVNCPAVPESILESELFGYERGAFTGARTSKPGRLELAHRGTLFLDEIAEISPPVQGKLLQVLDGEPVMRIGGVMPIQCDVRIIAATNADLEKAVQAKRMREDVFYRLSEVQVHIPPLRERKEDIPLLAEHFNFHCLQKLSKKYEPLPQDCLEEMAEQPWPGNARELAARVKKYVATGNREHLLRDAPDRSPPAPAFGWAEPSPPPGSAPPVAPQREAPAGEPEPEPARRPNDNGQGEAAEAEQTKPKEPGKPPFVPLKEAVQEVVEATEKSLIEEALRYTLWNRRQAARLLKISYSSLLRRIDAYNIGKSDSEN